MLSRPLFRFVRDDSRIDFMRGRYMGLIVSAVLSIASIILFFHPGLKLGLDFRGGVVVEAQTPQKADFGVIRAALERAHIHPDAIQAFGSDRDVRISINAPEGVNQAAQTQKLVDGVKGSIAQALPGTQVLRADAVGASVSSELFRDGVLALGCSLLMILVYIWIRFEREFAISAVVTLILDLTKTVGFLAVTRFEFDLVMVAALLTILGYSTNDKVVVYDRIRENLRKYRTMPLRELLNLSINETLNRTLGTSMTVFLAALPLALFGGSTLTGFATVMLFGIVVGTSSSIFIAAPLLLLLGHKRLRKSEKV
ncbi:protein translocase subunit SecF [Swingsia samuiensis]|uniref:Protein-export membrane protein SecF n=1 Tax=Swingsia samuiensis TaxID=1293412 RepID=A0A4Y6UK03_9PROT|nr:protein translocase subunit SecF [Swingsia samuiensis]QDH17892.1 protein translocase subunit SecF [Swingsia samuiensis]